MGKEECCPLRRRRCGSLPGSDLVGSQQHVPTCRVPGYGMIRLDPRRPRHFTTYHPLNRRISTTDFLEGCLSLYSTSNISTFWLGVEAHQEGRGGDTITFQFLAVRGLVFFTVFILSERLLVSIGEGRRRVLAFFPLRSVWVFGGAGAPCSFAAHSRACLSLFCHLLPACSGASALRVAQHNVGLVGRR